MFFFIILPKMTAVPKHLKMVPIQPVAGGVRPKELYRVT